METKLLLKTLKTVAFIAAATVINSTAAQTGGYTLDWFTIDGGGGTISGGDYTLDGTIGQPDAGNLTGGGYALAGGFWAGVISSPTLFITRAGAEATLFWTGGGFMVQSADDADGPWADFSAGVTTDGVHYGTNAPISGRKRFFRLRGSE